MYEILTSILSITSPDETINIVLMICFPDYMLTFIYPEREQSSFVNSTSLPVMSPLLTTCFLPIFSRDVGRPLAL